MALEPLSHPSLDVDGRRRRQWRGRTIGAEFRFAVPFGCQSCDGDQDDKYQREELAGIH